MSKYRLIETYDHNRQKPKYVIQKKDWSFMCPTWVNIFETYCSLTARLTFQGDLYDFPEDKILATKEVR
jgi:hypothetical protein